MSVRPAVLAERVVAAVAAGQLWRRHGPGRLHSAGAAARAADAHRVPGAGARQIRKFQFSRTFL